MNVEKLILDQLDLIDIARIEANERMEKGEACRARIQNAFDKAVAKPENVDLAGNVNWNFVHADEFFLDVLEPTEGEFKTMVARWEDKEFARIEIAFRNAEAKLEEQGNLLNL